MCRGISPIFEKLYKSHGFCVSQTNHLVVVSSIGLFSPLFREDFQLDFHIFQMGWFNHHLDHLIFPVLPGVPLSNNPFHKGIPGIQTTGPETIRFTNKSTI